MVESHVIPAIPKVELFPPGGPTLTTFCGCLAAVLEARGENPGYPYLAAASGMATRLCWRDGWDPSNVGLGKTEMEPFAPIHRALWSVGWEGAVRVTETCKLFGEVMPAGSPVSSEAAREEVVALLAGGQPVIGIGVVGPPEYCILTGFEAGGAEILGWSYFQADEGFAGDTYFRKRDWARDLLGYIVPGPRKAPPPLAQTGLAMVKATIEQARTPMIRGAHTGMAAWRALIDTLQNDDFSGLPLSHPEGAAVGEAFWSGTVKGRFMVYCDALMQIHDRQFAAQLLQRLAAEAEPSGSEAGQVEAPEPRCRRLTAAADLLDECSQYGGFLWHHLTGDDPGMQKFATPETRRILADEGRRVAALEERAVEQLEEWLALG